MEYISCTIRYRKARGLQPPAIRNQGRSIKHGKRTICRNLFTGSGQHPKNHCRHRNRSKLLTAVIKHDKRLRSNRLSRPGRQTHHHPRQLLQIIKYPAAAAKHAYTQPCPFGSLPAGTNRHPINQISFHTLSHHTTLPRHIQSLANTLFRQHPLAPTLSRRTSLSIRTPLSRQRTAPPAVSSEGIP